METLDLDTPAGRAAFAALGGQRAVTRARLALYAALYAACETSYPELARTLNRDHSTLLWGVKKAAAMAAADRDYATAVIQIAKAAQA